MPDKAAEAKLLHTNLMRADTTVAPANAGYPFPAKSQVAQEI